MNFARLVTLNFLPRPVDFGLLLLRVWLGVSIFWLHGLQKLQNFGATVAYFREMGFPSVIGAAAIIAEGVMSILLVIGLGTRWAALFLATTMAVAFYKAHNLVLIGKGSGEVAFVYLAGFLAILFAGPGRWSVDSRIAK